MGHVYMTIVVDLETGRIAYVGDGKGVDVLDGPVAKACTCRMQDRVCIDRLPRGFHVRCQGTSARCREIFDHFHIVKLMNEKLERCGATPTTRRPTRTSAA